MKIFIKVLLLSLISSPILSQTIVKGKITDGKSGKPLPYCTVYFPDKKAGTKSNNFGVFSLKSPKKETAIIVSYLGYEKKEVKLYGSSNDINVELFEKGRKTKVVQIRAKKKLIKDTLALRIIRNVIKNKNKNKPSSFNSLTYINYTKSEIDVANVEEILGKNFVTKPMKYILDYKSATPDGISYSPIIFREKIEKVYQKGKKKKVEIIGTKDNKLFDNESMYSLISYTFADYSIYDNQVIIANKSINSPLSKGAPILYRYYVDDSFKVDGITNYAMTYAPKSKEDFGFTGKLIVEKGSWAVKEAQIYLDKRANFNYISHFALEQNFEKHGGKWIIVKDFKDIAVGISRKNKKFIKARFREHHHKTDIQINPDIDSKKFLSEEPVYLKNYRKKSQEFWEQNRVDTLSKFESGIYSRADTFRKSKQYKTLKYMMRLGTTAYAPFNPANLEFGRATQLVSVNEYEGWRLKIGARLTYDSFKKMNIAGHIAYGTEDNKIKYGTRGFFNLPSYNRRFNRLSFVIKHDYDRLGSTHSMMGFDNTILTVFRSPDNRLRDIILKDQTNVRWIKEWKKGEETMIGFDRTRYYANKNYVFDEILDDGTINSKEHLTSFRINSYYRYAFKEPVFNNNYNRVRLKSIYPIVLLSSTIGINNFWDSEYSYMSLRANLKQNVPYLLGQLSYNLTAGKIFGKVPFIDMEQFGGNNGLIRDNNRFFLMNEGEYTADMYAQLWLQQSFFGFFLNKIPLIKKLKLREAIFLKSAIGSISEENANYYRLPSQMEAPSNGYLEAGFGISNIFKLFETNFVWRITDRDKPSTRKFGLLIGLKVEI